MLGSEAPPRLELLEFAAFSESYFEPVTVMVPGQSLKIPQSLIEAHKDEFWYINIDADDCFEYRSVEIPFAVADLCPNRNLTEGEWRSIGITQSKGWENFWRDSSERNVFMFRRPRVDVSARVLDEVRNGLMWTSSALRDTSQVPSTSFVIFPMRVFDNANLEIEQQLFGALSEVTFTSFRQLLEFQARVCRLSLSQLSN